MLGSSLRAGDNEMRIATTFDHRMLQGDALVKGRRRSVMKPIFTT